MDRRNGKRGAIVACQGVIHNLPGGDLGAVLRGFVGHVESAKGLHATARKCGNRMEIPPPPDGWREGKLPGALPEPKEAAIILGFPECVQGDLTRRAVISAPEVCAHRTAIAAAGHGFEGVQEQQSGTEPQGIAT